MTDTECDFLGDNPRFSNPELMSLIMNFPEVLDNPFENDFPTSPMSKDGSEEQADSTPSSKLSHEDVFSCQSTPATPFEDCGYRRDASITTTVADANDSPVDLTFDEILESENISVKLAERLKNLRSLVFNINILLFTEDREPALSAGSVNDARRMAYLIREWLSALHEVVKERFDKVAFMMTLAAFTSTPTPEYYWTSYKARTELIVRDTKVPKEADLKLLQSFVRIFEDFIYIGTIQFSAEIDQGLQDDLHSTYTTLLACERAYSGWVAAMKELGDVYMKPLMTELLADGTLQNVILTEDDELLAGVLAIERPSSLLMRLPSKATAACLRTSAEVVKQSRRFRRQYTL